MTMRPPETVMRLARMGASHQTRLSFMRVLLRGLRREGWRFDVPLWEIGAEGTGRAVYRATGPSETYSLVAFAHDLPDEMRSDRVIAEAWDATFTLCKGTPSPQDLDRLQTQVPLQEAGRVSDTELVLSRANRSTRLWAHVVSRLAAGQQPDPSLVAQVGYLMRTTAVYGSGKFGAADFAARRGRGLLGGPFRAEMLSVWLIRAFVMDLVEHAARQRSDRAVPLDPALRRQFGIGNSTGLGMAPFLVNHPLLLNNWIAARETALARVRAVAGAEGRAVFALALTRAQALVRGWTCADAEQSQRIAGLSRDLDLLEARAQQHIWSGPRPWDALYRWAEGALGVEAQELLASLMLEPHGPLVDDLAEEMSADEPAAFLIDGGQDLADLHAAIHKGYAWALTRDYTARHEIARFWYVSEAKLEPRLGERYADPGAALEQPLDVARAVSQLAACLETWKGGRTARDLLRAHPEHRRALRRVQLNAVAPYSEIRDNLISAEMRPLDMLRAKLAFFGATRFDPRSDRWLRITMFQGAPFPGELAAMPEDDWVYPALAPERVP